MKPQTLILVLSLFLFSLNGLANDLIQPSQNKGILVEEPIFEGNFYLEESGKQNPINVVLCHGTGNLGAKIWKDLIPELEKKYHVFAFDLPGFGRSDKNNELYSPENYTYFLKWFIDTHMKGKVYLVGHSMGGAIALYYAGKYPDNLDRLILIDAAGILHRAAFTNNILEGYLSGELKVGNQDLLERPLKGLKYLVKSTIETFDEKFMPDSMKQPLHLSTFRQKVLKGDPIKISGMALIHADFGQIIDHVKVPTYLIWGEKDSIAPVRTAKILAANIPETYLKIMPGLEHSPMLDHPDRFNEQVLKYLSDYPSEKFAKATDGKPFKDSDRVRSYKGKKDLTIKGNFKRIELIDCENILIKDTFSQHISIENSGVKIENTVIKSEDTGLAAINSIVQLTGVSISGKTAIFTSNSKLDMAGTSLTGSKSSIESDLDSTAVFSVSRVKSPYRDKWVHTIISLYMGEFY